MRIHFETRRELATAASVLVILTGYRLWLLAHVATRAYFDKYWYFAGKVLEGAIPTARLGDVSAGYLALVSLARWLGIDVHGLVVIQTVMLSLAALGVGLAARTIAGSLAGFAAGILLLANRELFVAATDLEPESIIVTFIALSLAFLAFALRDRERPGLLALAGLSVGMAALMRPVPLVVGGSILAWLGFRAVSSRAFRRVEIGWRAPLAFALGLAIPVAAGGIAVRTLGRSSTAMDPAMAFYEGMSPSADGYTGKQPAIVRELQPHFLEPDSLHVTYRVIAARAAGSPLGGDEANAFWLRRSLRFISDYPARALALIGRKIVFTFHAHEAWDLEGMFQRAHEVGSLWIPFSVLGPLAVAGLVIAFRRGEALAGLLTIVVLASGLHLVLFYVSSRQRNALIPAAVLAAAIAVDYAIRNRNRDARFIVGVSVVSVAVLAFSIPGTAQDEDTHVWTNYLVGQRLVSAASRVPPGAERSRMLADARSRGFGTPVAASDLKRIWLEMLPGEADPARRFDLAVALQSVGEWKTSGRLAADLDREGYEPRRGSRASNSLSYLRFRSLAHLGAPPDTLHALLTEADDEAPGDPWVLGAASVFETDPGALQRLEELHDPFTRDLALARAFWDAGNLKRALQLVRGVRTAVPEWDRARELEALLMSRVPRSPAMTDRGSAD